MLVHVKDNHYDLVDHAGGFDFDHTNSFLESVKHIPVEVHTEYILSQEVRQCYPNIEFKFLYHAKQLILNSLANYKNLHQTNFNNFICCFNGSEHVGRKLLIGALRKRNWFDPKYCSKNFSYTVDMLDGHIDDLADNPRLYRKFFDLSDNDFAQELNSFGYDRFDHSNNIYKIDSKISQSFVHVVSETLSSSYHPFVTEKFLYSVVTKGLFVAYAQPGWHQHVLQHFGFKPYQILFNYEFDLVANPVLRLVELLCMLSKYSGLSKSDWHDLYELERDTIEFNYNHYFSQDYLKCLAKYA